MKKRPVGVIIRWMVVLGVVCALMPWGSVAGEKIKESGTRDQELIQAAARGDAELVKSLLEKGAEVNTKNQESASALTEAAHFGHLDLVDLFIGKGPDISPHAHLDKILPGRHYCSRTSKASGLPESDSEYNQLEKIDIPNCFGLGQKCYAAVYVSGDEESAYSQFGQPARLCFIRQNGKQFQPCFEANSKRFHYQFVQEMRLIPIFKKGFPREGVLFIAMYSAGGSRTISLVTLWVFDREREEFFNILPKIQITNEGEYMILSGADDLLDGVFVTAHARWGEGETHFAPHYYEIRAYQYNERDRLYRMVSSYTTQEKYPSLDDAEKIDVITHEIENIRSIVRTKRRGG